MIIRLLLLASTLAFAFGLVGVAGRRPHRRASTGAGAGVMLVTGPGCRLCEPARLSLVSAGIEFRTVAPAEVPDLGIRSLPTILVIDRAGRVRLRRSGRAAVTDTAAVVAAAELAAAG